MKIRVSDKEPSNMSGNAINKELDKIDAYDSVVNQALIQEGRGHEKYQDVLKKTDQLSLAARALINRRQRLRIEIEMRYGPGAPSRLPKGFGKRNA